MRIDVKSTYMVQELIADREALLASLISKSVVTGDRERALSPSGNLVNWLVDTRVLLLDPVSMRRIGRLFLDAVRDLGPFQLAALEMTGIPLMAGIQQTALAEGLVINGLIIRKEPKGNGRMRVIEGEPNDLPVIFVDDVLNSADTFMQGMEVLRFNGLHVPFFWALIDFHRDYGLQRVLDAGCSLITEFSFEELGLAWSEPEIKPEPFPWQRGWQFRPDPPVRSCYLMPRSTPAVGGDRVFYGAENGRFYALDTKTGVKAWSFQTVNSDKGIASVPLLVEGAVVFGAYDGNVYCLDQETGAVRWKFVEADWIGSSPALVPGANRIVIGLEHSLAAKQGSIVALDLATGERVWECPTPGMVHGTPLYVKRHDFICCGTNDAELLVLDAGTGHIRAILPLHGALKSIPTYDPEHEAVIFGDLSGKVYSFSLDEFRLRWTAQAEDGVYAQPLVFGSKVFVPGMDKHLYTFDTETGLCLARTELVGKLFGGVRRIEDKIYVGTTAGRLYCIDAESNKVHSHAQLHERITTPLGAGEQPDRIYVLTNDSVLSSFTGMAL